MTVANYVFLLAVLIILLVFMAWLIGHLERSFRRHGGAASPEGQPPDPGHVTDWGARSPKKRPRGRSGSDFQAFDDASLGRLLRRAVARLFNVLG